MKRQRRFRSIVTILLALVLGLSFTACGNGNPNEDNTETGNKVEVSIASAASTIKLGETVKLNVTVSGTDDKRFAWSTNNDEVLAVSNDNVVSVKKNVSVDTIVAVTATSAADPTAKASHTFTVRPAIAGQVGELTAAMITAISGDNITFTGTVTDVFRDFQTPSNSETSEYSVTVKMNPDKWYGKWGKIINEVVENELEDNYAKGDEIEKTGEHEWIRRYIGINNDVVEEVQRASSNRRPISWESRHLWNPIAGLGADISNKFVKISDEYGERYQYQIDLNPVGNAEYSDDAWLMTYLPIALTPMMTETFDQFYFIVEGGEITKILAQTEVLSESDSNDEVLYNSYTTVELTISDIGRTEVPEPEGYGAPSRYATELGEAIAKMKTTKNYTFAASQSAVSAPVVSDDDYSYEYSASVPTGGKAAANSFAATTPTVKGPFHGHDSANSSRKLDGGIGTLGYMTEDVVLFEEWGEYTAYDTNPYYVRYSGYKQFGTGEDKYFERFSDGHNEVGDNPQYLKGYKYYSGDMWEKKLPQWNVSPNIFEWKRSGTVYVNGVAREVQQFELRDSAVTAEVTKQIAADSNSDYGYPAAFKKLTISVDIEKKEVVEIVYPYDIAVGTYTGYVTIQIYNVGTTVLDPADFTGEYYIPREVRTEWSQYDVMYYYPNHSSVGAATEAKADKVLADCYGSNVVAILPKPEIFMNIMGGDNIYGPFFDWETITDGDEVTYKDSLSFNMSMEEEVWNSFYDISTILGEHGSLTEAICTPGSGWTYSISNSGWASEGSDYYYGTYTHTSGIMLVVENNATKNFFCYFYKSGEWHKR